MCLRVMGAQLLASWLESGAEPARRHVVLGVLNAAAGGDRPMYQVDETARRLLCWHAESGKDLLVPAAFSP